VQNLPARLAANAQTGYAKIYDWTLERRQIQDRIEDAFERRTENEENIDNSLLQMKRNTCD
jgi:hypothetical protein